VDQAEKAIVQVRASVRDLLSDKLPGEKVTEIAGLLSEGTWTHDHPITFDMAQQFGLPVSTNMPAELLELMGLYPQPVKRQPTVEYLPQRREGDSRPQPR
jgi:hypothetical protein